MKANYSRVSQGAEWGCTSRFAQQQSQADDVAVGSFSPEPVRAIVRRTSVSPQRATWIQPSGLGREVPGAESENYRPVQMPSGTAPE